MYRLAKSGREVSIARSRVPIVAGELLRGATYFPSFFLIANIAVWLCIFFATLGVEADQRGFWESILFSNVTTLAMPNTVERRQARSLQLQSLDTRNLTCKTGNETHAQFWPATFNTTIAVNSSSRVTANDALCQAHAPGFQPLLTVQCVPRRGTQCQLDENQGWFSTQQTTVAPLVHRLDSYIEVVEHPFKTDGDLPPEFAGTNGMIFVFRHSRPSASPVNHSALVFLHNPTTNDSYIAPVVTLSRYENFLCLQPLRILLGESTSLDLFHQSCRKNTDLGRYMMGRDLSQEYRSDFSPSSVYVEGVLRHVLRGMPLSASKTGYILHPKRDVTVISTTATVLYSIIITLAVVLFPVKELLTFFLVRRKQVAETALFLNDFNELSKLLRFKMDQESEIPPTGEFAVWDTFDE